MKNFAIAFGLGLVALALNPQIKDFQEGFRQGWDESWAEECELPKSEQVPFIDCD